MTLTPPVNKNYCATVVQLKDFVDLPNCDNVKAAIIFGNQVIVGKDTPVGETGLFFPLETALSKEFLGNNNLFRKPELGNKDPEKKGFFEENGRVRAVKFRGHKSEGFFVPFDNLAYLNTGFLELGTEFDKIGEHEICSKYIPKRNKVNTGAHGNKPRNARVEDRVVDGQFRLHYDTENLRRNVEKISPTDFISISDKLHGTSAVFANVLVKRELNWFERLLQRVHIPIDTHKYGIVWSSRRVVKGVDSEEKQGARHFYTTDIWGVVAKEIGDKIPKGFTLYGEILGYTPDGAAIQKGYHYGCAKGEHKFVVYRVTHTNPDGFVTEMPWLQMEQFCAKYGFTTVPKLWYGRAAYAASELWDGDWSQHLLRSLEGQYVNDGDCQYNPGLPAEGIVVRVDHLDNAEAYKLKNYRFLEHETKLLDKGEVDIETEESVGLSI